MKKIVVLLLFAVFLVLPVSAADEINYWNTAYLSPLSASGTTCTIIGQSLKAVSTGTGSYASYRYQGSMLADLKGKRLYFSFTFSVSGENKGQINVVFYSNGEILKTYYAQGRRMLIEVPQNFDEVHFVVYSNCGGTASAGDSVMYTDILLTGERDINAEAGFLDSLNSVFGFFGDVFSEMMDVVFSYRFMAVAILMPFLVWLVWRVMQWFQVPAAADIRVPDLRGKFGLKRLGAKRMKGRTVKIDGRYYMIPMGKTRGKHRAKKQDD